MDNAQAQVYFGTAEPRPDVTSLHAGALSVELVEGNVRAVRWHGQEVLRAVAYVVRDRDWGTIAPRLRNLEIRQDEGEFRVGYDAACANAGATLTYRATLTGRADGTLVFAVEAKPDRAFETNRCGFCVLHPIVGVAGQPARVEHVDGTERDARFPELIEPWQPFKDMRAITHEVAPGVSATCRMEGDTFEMEDQRNWSDASYKTYVRPLERPWPYQMPAGVAQAQTITLTITGGAATAVRAHGPVVIELGAPQGTMPRFGLVVTPAEAADVLRNAARLREVAPQVLLLHFDPVAGHAVEALTALAAVRKLLPGSEAVLECVVPGTGDPEAELRDTAALVRAAGLDLDALAVCPSVDRQSTPPGSVWPPCPPLASVYAAARAAFPGLPLGGGMFSYFTELNRKRPPVDLLDFVTHCTCPIVHAADDVSVMQSLEALPFIVRSARAIVGSKPYRIGPSTIGMRQNPYGSRTFANPDNGRLTMTHADPRQRGLFAAAWMVGYLAETADAELDTFTGGALTGAFGLMPSGDTQGDVFPVFHVAKGAAALARSDRLACHSSDPQTLLGFAVQRDGRTTLWLANVTDRQQTATLPAGFDRAVVFDHESWTSSATGLEPEPVTIDPARVVLAPYAVGRFSA